MESLERMEIAPAASVSLGILPMIDASPDEEQDRFTRGLVEDLIIDLSRFSNLALIDSHSAFASSMRGLHDRDVAGKLGADFLLRTSLRKRDAAFRINARLIDPSRGAVLWADRYDVPGEDIFTIQDEVVEQVTSALSKHIDLAALRAARKKPIPALAAYDCWLRGYDKIREGSIRADAKAREYFERALEIDPHYARAFVGLSLSHFNDWSCQAWELSEASECLAYENAWKAIRLDEQDHVAHYVLGRVMMFRREFDRAEQHLERSLALNFNDADSLVQIGMCKSFLGDARKGSELFDRAIRLNPLHDPWYLVYGAFNHFVLKDYEAQLRLALRVPPSAVWIDHSAFIAAAFAHRHDATQAAKYLAIFRENFQTKVSPGHPVRPGDEMRWLTLVNPFRRDEDREHFTEGLRLAGLSGEPGEAPSPPTLEPAPGPCVFALEKGVRRMTFEGGTVCLSEVKGFADIERLLASHGGEIHCAELMGGVWNQGGTDELLDQKARAAYRERICELQADVEEAEESNDAGRVERIREELDPLLDALARASGLHGRSRMLKDPSERARSAVTWRIRSAIKKIRAAHPTLGRHFENSIRTGVFCSYAPEKPVDWRL